MKFSRILGVLLVVGVAAALAWHLRPEASAAAAATGGGSTGVVVATTRVAQRDMPAWLSGLGTVRAYNTVTVRPRVNGTLDQVNFTEGQEVAAGDVLARIDPRPYQSALDQALARQRQDEALLLNAQRELERSRQLVADRAESRQILDQKESDLAQADAAVHADYASVQAAELDLEFTTVRAPIAGRTGVRLIDAGNLVSANQTTGLVVITQMRPVSVLFTLGQQYLPALRRGMAANGGPLDVEALAPDGSSLGRGKLELIDNQIDGSTGSVRLKARFENDDQALWPGQFVSTRILVETRRQAAVVPAEVVQAGVNGPFAYVVKPDQTVEARPLTVGPSVDGFTIIERGLAPGEEVVREGQVKLEPGTKISASDTALPTAS